MSAREEMLASIRRNRPSLDAALPDIPRFSDARPQEKVARFSQALAVMGGSMLQPGPENDPLLPARAMVAKAGVTCSMVAELRGNRDLAGADPASLHDVDLAIVRARFGVAETGSVALLTTDLGVASIGYLAQRLLILLDPDDIVMDLHRAYERAEFHEGAYLVLQTGPSATADIEGVLIRGAQGIRALTVLLAPRACANGG